MQQPDLPTSKVTPANHTFNTDIRDITLSQNPDISEEKAYQHIRKC